jgi:predicted DNA-binding transcriptional regulator AlpA
MKTSMGSLEGLPPDLGRDRLLRSDQTAEFLGVSVADLRRLYRSRRVPPPIKIGARQYGWRLSALIDFVDQKARQAATETAAE